MTGTTTIINSKSGHEYRLLRTAQDTDGALLHMEVSFRPKSAEPPAHYHPFQAERFFVSSGALTMRMREGVRVLVPGDSLFVPEGTVHSMWNGGDEPCVVSWRVTPALETAQLFATLAQMANDGETDESGVPRLPQVIRTLRRFSDEFRIAIVPLLLRHALFALVTRVAYRIGYSSRRRHDAPRLSTKGTGGASGAPGSHTRSLMSFRQETGGSHRQMRSPAAVA